ncbi:MAG: TraR/DksA family transcriptional regulator [Parvibaculaceae bacterium]|nr:TraR/DksA family transcriptional regulator [Parvibaculaceae bacterium]
MDTLSHAEVAEFRRLLLEQQGELLALKETSKEASETVDLDQTMVGRLSRIDALQGQAMAQETARRRDVQLKKIGAALERMAEDEYGYCAVCGELVKRERLLLDPATATCVEHAVG